MAWHPIQSWKNKQALKRALSPSASALAKTAPSAAHRGLSLTAPLAFGLALGFPFAAAWTWPFLWWATSLHESCHALMAWITGGHVLAIDLHGLDAVTLTSGGVYPLISIAGYTGCALIGSLLLRSATWRPELRWTLLSAVLVAPEIVIAVTGKWSMPWLASLAVGGALFYLGRKRSQLIAGFLAALLFWQTWSDIGVLIFHLELHSDARLLAEYCGAPFLSLPIAVIMCAICLWFWFGAFRAWVRAWSAPAPKAALSSQFGIETLKSRR